jgi:predicted transcriptional regulator
MTNLLFQTMEAVENYLAGDTIECLICGKTFGSSLSVAHLRLHGMTHDEYRIRFGIPFKRSLTSAPFRAKLRAVVDADYIARLKNHKTTVEECSLHAPRRPLSPAVVNKLRKNRTQSPGGDRTMPAHCVCGCEILTTGLTASQPQRCQKCYARAAQRARESYWHRKAVAESEKDPIFHPPFETIEEVEDYLSEGTITCLLCDARLQRLDKHLSLHRISADGYRARFNIPFDRPLMSAACLARSRASFARLRSQCEIERYWISPWGRKFAS